MSSPTIAFPETLELRRAERSHAADRAMWAAIAGGLAASVAAYLVYDSVVRSQLRPDQFVAADLVKPPIYYALHAVELVLLTIGGLIAFAGTNLRKIERGFILRWALLLGAAMLMALRGFSATDFLSTRLVDGSGPYPIFLSILFFAGARRSNWVLIEKIMIGFAAVFGALILFRITQLSAFTRQEAVANLGLCLNCLFWPAAWIALRPYPSGSMGSRLKLLPAFVFAAGSFFTQTRLNFVMLFSLLGIYALVRRKRRERQAGLWLAIAAGAIWLALFAGLFLRDSRWLDRLSDVSTAFAGRLDEDTRTEQFTAFFQTVAPSELILGRGSRATWDWDGYEWRGATDLGYLSMLLYGGLPLLLTYLATHVKPCISTFFRTKPDWRTAAAGVGILWAIRMFSSSYPGTTPDYYIVLLCIGAAISREPDPVPGREP